MGILGMATIPGELEGCFSRKVDRLAKGGNLEFLICSQAREAFLSAFILFGCELVAALEIDGHAVATHAKNFFQGGSESIKALHAKPHDITKIEPEDVAVELAGAVEDAIDLIVGGPPCQAYARVGRAKLREVAEHPQAFKVDPRGNLYLRYLHYVSRMKPLALLMENVPDIMNYGGHNVVQEVAEALDALGMRPGIAC